MARKKENPISLKFVFFVIAMITVIFCYLNMPNDISKIKESKTFDEMLEYTNGEEDDKDIEPYSVIDTDILTARPQKQTKKKIEEKKTYKPLENIHLKTQTDIDVHVDNSNLEYNKLLDKLKQYPNQSLSSVQAIINNILEYKGYYSGTLKVVTEEAQDAQSQTQGSYIAAFFNIQTGNVHVNKKALYSLPIPVIVAILAHELDHFDKIAQLCKSMGVENFVQLAKDNKMANINEEFWARACKRANLKNYDAQYYKDAFVRYLSQGTIDLVSTYSDLYRLSEHMRNPLEISAYEISDYVLAYYNIHAEDGPLKKLITQFNKVDWAIYNLINKNAIIKQQRIAFFDYFFIQAIIKTFPKYINEYNNCISNKNGDMTTFWLQFEKDNMSLYSKNKQIDEQTYKNIYLLLEKTEELAKTELTNTIVCDALKYKVNTLLSNIVYPNAIKNIKSAAEAYIEYTSKYKIQSPQTELDMNLTLICIENELYTNTQKEMPSLFYIKIPNSLVANYLINSKARRFYFIYKNPAFLSELNHRKAKHPFITEQILLKQLIEEHRLNVRIAY